LWFCSSCSIQGSVTIHIVIDVKTFALICFLSSMGEWILINQHWISKLITAEIDRGVVKDNKKKETHTLKRLNFSGSRRRGEMGSDGKEGTYISNRLPV
ncbi:hypothetical protein MKW98_032075, partial [Papaver atlanticum]